MNGACSFPGCKNDLYATGLCGTHCWQRSVGRELTPIRYKGAKRDRFWEKVNKDGPVPTNRPEIGACWLWTGAVQQGGGYGMFWTPGRMRRAHKYSYERAKGLVPAGLELDHVCRVRLCVNPAHLEAVTRSENTLRAFAAKRMEHKSDSGIATPTPHGGTET